MVAGFAGLMFVSVRKPSPPAKYTSIHSTNTKCISRTQNTLQCSPEQKMHPRTKYTPEQNTLQNTKYTPEHKNTPEHIIHFSTLKNTKFTPIHKNYTPIHSRMQYMLKYTKILEMVHPNILQYIN